jgi:arginine deiminase
MFGINVNSETDPLKTVILHQPGYEHRKTVPWNKDAILFDDLLDLDAARQEHKEFSLLLSAHGVEVLFLLDMIKEICSNRDTAEKVYADVLGYETLNKIDPKQLHPWHLVHGFPEEKLITENCLIQPLANLYFMRDPAFAVPGALIISNPFWPARKQESLLMRALFHYHPRFEGVKLWDGLLDVEGAHVEGGDVLVASADTLMIGVGERTSELGADILAEYLFANTEIKRILKIKLPGEREFMHLDTVLTFVDRQQILTMPYLWERPDLYADIAQHAKLFCKRNNQRYTGPDPESLCNSVGVTMLCADGSSNTWTNVLEALAELEIINPDWTVTVAGHVSHYSSPEEHIVEALREQWNDAANTFALKPGQVLCYDRNINTLRALEEAHVETVRFAGSDLVRGRGGARCMTFPICRGKCEY